MAIHISRDFLTLGCTFPTASMYLASIFMYGTLGFTQVGATNFNVTGSFLVGSGLSASINMGVSNEYAVAIPTASYVVSASDVNRILVLKSTANPRYNSGLFRVTSVNTLNNWAIVDWRSGDFPPAEIDTLDFKFFVNENQIGGETSAALTYTTGSPGPPGSGYRSRGALFAGKRIILQSPHSSSWQVRLCYESGADRAAHLSFLSVAPGIGGDSRGDFPSGSLDTSRSSGEHLHTTMWWDVLSSNYEGTVPSIDGLDNADDTANVQVRYSMWGDDVSGSFIGIVRNVTNYVDHWWSFGMADDGQVSLPPKTIQRLFAFGRAGNTADIGWRTGPVESAAGADAHSVGVAFGLNNRPVSCVMSTYCFLGKQASSATGPRRVSLAADNVILGATEAMPVELFAGTCESGISYEGAWPTGAVFEFDPRRMGFFPMARLGRANHTEWASSNDASKTWYHAIDGIFLPWAGPTVLA